MQKLNQFTYKFTKIISTYASMRLSNFIDMHRCMAEIWGRFPPYGDKAKNPALLGLKFTAVYGNKNKLFHSRFKINYKRTHSRILIHFKVEKCSQNAPVMAYLQINVGLYTTGPAVVTFLPSRWIVKHMHENLFSKHVLRQLKPFYTLEQQVFRK